MSVHFDPMLMGAVVARFPGGRVHRLVLTRTWTVFDDPRRNFLTFVMLNPSVADGRVNDPTIRRCVAFAQREGYGGLEVYNLHSLVSTDPRNLIGAIPYEPNDGYLEAALISARDGRTKIICAWGANPAAEHPGANFRARARLMRVPLFCLGRTTSGEPRHPVRLNSNQPLEPYP